MLVWYKEASGKTLDYISDSNDKIKNRRQIRIIDKKMMIAIIPPRHSIKGYITKICPS